MVQVPMPTKLTSEPDTVQTDVVADEKTTGLPEPPPVAVTPYFGPFTVASDGDVEVKVMVCGI